MIEQIKSLRVQIDGLTQLTKSLDNSIVIEWKTSIRGFSSAEIEKSYDSLLLAKAWLGKILGELGNPTPYQKDGNRHSIEDIEKTADTYKDSTIPGIPMFPLYLNNHIEKVDWLRQEVQKVIDTTDPYKDYEDNLIWRNFSTKANSQLFNSNRYLIEARFYLGFELQRLKEESK